MFFFFNFIVGGIDKIDINYDGKNGIRLIGISLDGWYLVFGDRIGNVRYM